MINFPSWAEMTEKEKLESTYSDVFKSVNGFRPRCFNLTVNELKAALVALAEDSNLMANEENDIPVSYVEDWNNE